jgi:hypothetical protein
MTGKGHLGPLVRTRGARGAAVTRGTNLIVWVQGWGWRAGRCTECQDCDTRCRYASSILTKSHSRLSLSLISRRASHTRMSAHTEASIADGITAGGTGTCIWIHSSTSVASYLEIPPLAGSLPSFRTCEIGGWICLNNNLLLCLSGSLKYHQVSISYSAFSQKGRPSSFTTTGRFQPLEVRILTRDL